MQVTLISEGARDNETVQKNRVWNGEESQKEQR